MKIKAVGAYSAKQPLEPMDITRREPGPVSYTHLRAHETRMVISYAVF